MSIGRRDELAARVAASLASSEQSPEQVAARAYAIADALLARAQGTWPIHELIWPEEPLERLISHDPRWELEPRWSRRDRLACEQASAAARGPGLASTRPAAARKRDAG